MLYIVASTGRAGSRAVAMFIFNALTKKAMPIVRNYDEFYQHDGKIVKTHLHFKEELKCPYRAVYIYCNIGDCISSLARMSYGFLRFHLSNLEVREKHLNTFLRILRLPLHKKIRRFFAFYYIVKDDKLRFKENIASWHKAKHALFVKREDLVSDKEKISAQISARLDLPLGTFEPKERNWRKKDLPLLLRWLIDKTYPDFR
ncbi:MAG: hypothetical protein ABIH57_03605 [Candidatus Omnitrophota bacterium]